MTCLRELTFVEAILVLRTYAIYDRNIKILVLVGSLGLMVPSLGFVSEAC